MICQKGVVFPICFTSVIILAEKKKKTKQRDQEGEMDEQEKVIIYSHINLPTLRLNIFL